MSNRKAFKSKLVNLDISSNTNSGTCKIKNVCVVNSMKLSPKCLNLDIVKYLYSHLKDIEFSNINVDSDISILIGDDNPMLHLHMDICARSE